MKVISPVQTAVVEPVSIKKPIQAGVEVSGHLKSTYPIPPQCDKLDIRPLWDEFHYRLNYWGNTKVRKNSGLFTDAYVILMSMMVSVKKENNKITSKVISKD